jgi:transketolase C-terminal domain/subunit
MRGLAQGPLKIVEGQSDCALVATGSILQVALEAARKLADEGISVSVFSCPWLQPAGADFFQPLAMCRRLVVLEEHVRAGGLASMLLEQLPGGLKILSLTPSTAALNQVGSQNFLRGRAGINTEAVMGAVRQIF